MGRQPRHSRQSGYRPAVVTFMDILGVRELVARDAASEVSRTLRLLRRSTAPPATSDDGDADADETTVAFNFSDCVIRVRHYDAQFSMGALHHEIINLVHAQADLVHQGVLVRGGMTVGEIRADGDSVFGPAFNRAYELESGYATFPRIVIGPETFSAYRTDPRLLAEHHGLEDEIPYIRELLRRGDDGLWFVDYLRAIRGEMDAPEEYPDLLDEHRSLILSRMRASRASPRIVHKMLWLASYHNEVCAAFDPESEALIGSSDMPELEELAERPPFHEQ